MEDKELLTMWKSQNEKIEQSLAINRKLLMEAVNQKAQTSLRSMKRLKTAGIVSFVLYLFVLGYVLLYAISNYSTAANYFIVSFFAIFLINLKGFVDYIKHLYWVNSIDYSGTITEIQQKLSKLQFSIVNHTKIMVLQLPFWTTFYLSDRWFPSNIGVPYMIFQILLTGGFTYLAFWLYRNQHVDNLDKKWYKTLMAGSGGRSIREALAFYKEIETFKTED